MLFEFARHALPLLCVGGRLLLHGYIRPFAGIFRVDSQPLFQTRLSIGLNGIHWAFGLAYSAIDTFIGVNHQHVLPFIEAVDRAYLYTVHVFTLDAIFVDDVSHFKVGFISFRPCLLAGSVV